MSETFTFYVIDENKLPGQLQGIPDRAKHATLTTQVKAKGARWTSLELKVRDFAGALEAIDSWIGGTRFLPAFAFLNSPRHMLDPDRAALPFGYFTPLQAQYIQSRFQQLPPEVVSTIFSGDNEALKQVFHAIESSVGEAAKRGYACAIIHS